jgi:TP901 family phage tail tape measure protein
MAATFPLAVVISAVDRVTSPLRKIQSSIGSFGKRMSSIGSTLTKAVSIPLAGIGGLSLAAGVQMERTLRRVEALLGADADQAERLRAAIKALPDSIGMQRGLGVLEGLAEEGFNAEEALVALQSTTLLAKAAHLDAADAASIVADTLAAVGGDANDAQHLVDLLTKATRGSSKGMREFAQVLQVAGPGFKASGMSIEDMIAAVKGFAAANFEGSAGASALRAAISALQNPSRSAVDTLGRLGIHRSDLFTATGDVRSLSEVLLLLRSRGATVQDFLEIFGNKVGTAFAAVDPGKIAEARAELDDVAGATQAAADRVTDPLETMGNSFFRLGVALAQSGMLEALGELVNKLVPLVRWISNLNPEILQWAIAIAGVAIVAGPVISVVGGIATAVGVLWPLLASFVAFLGAILIPGIVSLGAALFATPIGWVILGIAALIAAGVALWKNWDRVLGFLKKAWHLWITPVRLGIEWLISKLPRLGDLLPDWVKGFIGISTEPTAAAAETVPSESLDRVAASGRQEVISKSEAAVRVDFENLPPGAQVTTNRNDGVDLDLRAGYAMGT